MALTTDEETSLKSVELLIEKFRELNIKPKLTIVGEPTNSTFALFSNACYEYKATFYGKACHSSKINEGVNAICACAKLISFIESRQKDYKLTSNCGVVCGGEVVNKVPDFAEVTFDIRTVFDNELNKFIIEIEQYIKRLENEYDGLVVKIQNMLKCSQFRLFR